MADVDKTYKMTQVYSNACFACYIECVASWKVTRPIVSDKYFFQLIQQQSALWHDREALYKGYIAWMECLNNKAASNKFYLMGKYITQNIFSRQWMSFKWPLSFILTLLNFETIKFHISLTSIFTMHILLCAL